MKINNLSPADSVFLIHALDIARYEFVRNGEVAPHLYIANPHGRQPLRVPLGGAPKHLASAIINEGKDSFPIILVTEAWVTKQTVKPDSALAKAIKEDPSSALILEPRTDPDRTEAVLVQFFSKERHIMCNAEIRRPQQGAPTLGEWVVADNAETIMRRANFSPPGARLASGNV